VLLANAGGTTFKTQLAKAQSLRAAEARIGDVMGADLANICRATSCSGRIGVLFGASRPPHRLQCAPYPMTSRETVWDWLQTPKWSRSRKPLRLAGIDENRHTEVRRKSLRRDN
jgi:hypothetical protein